MTVINRITNCKTEQFPEVWHYQLFQVGNDAGWKLYNDTSYIVMFDAWSDANRPINLDFEDNFQNQFNRFGYSEDLNAIGGKSEWTIDISPERKTYVQHVTMSQLLDNSSHKIVFMLSGDSHIVFLDNIYLVSIGDYEQAIKGNKTVVFTNSVISVNTDSAVVKGSIAHLGNGSLLNYGHCWSTHTTPTISDNKTALGACDTTGVFTSTLLSLTPQTKYYVRAYATDSVNTVYGEEITVYTELIPISITP